jgi:predicted nucleotidyltransferase
VILFTPEDRDETAARVLALLREDERVERTELGGSLAAGSADRWSDVDVDVTLAEGVDPGVVADDWIARAYEVLPVVHHFAVAFGAVHVRGLLLESLLEVDVSFEPPVDQDDDWPRPDAGAEAGFGWHDVLHAGVAIARGRPWRAQYYIGLLRWRTLTLATERLGIDFCEYKGVDDLPVEVLGPLEAAFPRSLEAVDLSGAARAATGAFLGELRHVRPDLAGRLEPRLLAFLDETV